MITNRRFFLQMDILSELPESDFYKDEQEKLLLSYRIHKLKNKPYLVFLHGYNGNSKSWAYQFRFFKEKYSLITIDFPGFGRSENMEDSNMFRVADMIYRFLKNNNIINFSLVGHSMGGMLAQVISAKYPESITKLILSCTHTGYNLPNKSPLRQPYLDRLQQRKVMTDKEYGILRIKRMLPKLKNQKILEFLAKISEEITQQSILCGGTAMQILNTKELLNKIHSPCLILTGSDDVVVSKEKSSILISEIKHSIHKEISGVGHAPYCEDQEKFNNYIDTFLNS